MKKKWIVLVIILVTCLLSACQNTEKKKKLNCTKCHPSYEQCDVGCPLG